jgi:protein ImuB
VPSPVDGVNVLPVRTCCIWCRDWAVVVVRRRDPTTRNRPVVVRERVGSRDVVRCASPEARAVGIVPGLSRREAEARCPGVMIDEVDRGEEARAFEVVARAVEALTPRLELEEPGLLSFPTRGPARYYGGDEGLAARVRAAAGAVLGPDAATLRVGIADGRFAARLAARIVGTGGTAGTGSGGLIVAPGETAAFLAPHPVAVLDVPDLAVLLVRLGLPTLGAFAALPAGSVLTRFGVEGARLHRLAHGDDDRPLVLTSPPTDCAEHVSLDPPATRVDHVAFVAKGLADRLVERLADRGLGCTCVVVTAETEHGERLERTWRHVGAFAPGALSERVRWQLEGWLAAREPGAARGTTIVEGDARALQDAMADAEGFDTTTGALVRLGLVPDEVVTLSGRQLGFWGGDLAAADRADRTFARVQGMLGYDAVVTGVAQGGRTPAEQIRWVPWGEPREPERPLLTAGERPPWPGALPPPAPTRLFDPPLPAELLDAGGRPVIVSGRGEASAAPARLRCRGLRSGGGAVVAWAGPWPHDLRWWDRAARRRRVLWQIVTESPDGPVACLVALEGSRAGIEALYD